MPTRTSRCRELSFGDGGRKLSLAPENNAFGRCAPSCYFQDMSQLATTDPQQLRALLHERLDHCSDMELEAVRKTLLQLEAERLMTSIGEAVDEAIAAGKFDDVEAGIRDHRARHPYR